MALEPGTRHGVFEILAPLRKGGMGEVYRAKDTKLEREVAVKILSRRWRSGRIAWCGSTVRPRSWPPSITSN